MKFMAPLVVVEDIEASKCFYEEVLGEKLRFDFGANKQFYSGLSIQAKASMKELFGIEAEDVRYGGRDTLLYFETEEFERFLLRIRKHALVYLNGEMEPAQYEWGQRCIRFYDPDMHIIEVAESMGDVVRRFFAQGLTAEDIVSCTQFSMEYVEECLE